MKILAKSAEVLAIASKGNPITTTIVVFLFYLFFSILEAGVEKLIFGERFEHFIDPFFIGFFIAYSAYAVYACAEYNSASS